MNLISFTWRRSVQQCQVGTWHVGQHAGPSRHLSLVSVTEAKSGHSDCRYCCQVVTRAVSSVMFHVCLVTSVLCWLTRRWVLKGSSCPVVWHASSACVAEVAVTATSPHWITHTLHEQPAYYYYYYFLFYFIPAVHWLSLTYQWVSEDGNAAASTDCAPQHW